MVQEPNQYVRETFVQLGTMTKICFHFRKTRQTMPSFDCVRNLFSWHRYHRRMIEILSCNWRRGSEWEREREGRMKKKVVCWPRRLTLASFRCGMWNILSLPPYTVSCIHIQGVKGRTYCNVGPVNSRRMPKYSRWAILFFTSVFYNNASLRSCSYC